MRLIIIIFFLVFSIDNSIAACKLPSGSYAATINGSWGNWGSGALSNQFVTSFLVSATSTITFAKDGSAKYTEYGKRSSLISSMNGQYTETGTIPPAFIVKDNNREFNTDEIQHIFYQSTCRGYFKTSNGKFFVYVSINSGNKISGTYMGNDTLFFTSDVVWEKI